MRDKFKKAQNFRNNAADEIADHQIETWKTYEQIVSAEEYSLEAEHHLGDN